MNGTFLGRFDGRDAAGRRHLQASPPVESRPEKLELILDQSSALLPFHFLRTGDRLGRAVVKLLRSDGAAGTGFLVAPGILLTNHHVLPDPATAALTIALANYEAAPPDTSPGRPVSVALEPEDLFVTNAGLDFTFCGVRGLEFLGTIGLDRNSLNIDESETVNIIQHPRGRPKEVALRDNCVVKADFLVVQYSCSTEPGSSGSPVFNNRWEPVALHHASVKSKGPDARPADGPSAEGPASYLNEGIRISAIAIWLETDEANAPDLRDQSARLRGIFGGIDPRVGFFGALGRKSLGRPAPEVVVESYRGDTDDLDLAFWDLRGVEPGAPRQVADVARIMADMGMDLWFLAHAEPPLVEGLLGHLRSQFGLDYESSREPGGDHPAPALLYRRDKALAVERRPWGAEPPEGMALPPLITVRAATRRSGSFAFRVAPISPADEWPTAYAEAVRRALRRDRDGFDWILAGEASVLLAPEALHLLADGGRALLAAADRDGAVVLLTGPRSKVTQVFASPNLRAASGEPGPLRVIRDRELPSLLRGLGCPPPMALRLSLDAEPALSPPAPLVPPAPIAPAVPLADDDLERRIRDVIMPILAQLIDEIRPQTGGAG